MVTSNKETICRVCGNTFLAVSRVHKHCSAKCNQKHFRDNNKARLKLVKKNDYLIRTYGISLETYNKMLIHQNFGCFICSSPKGINGKELAVDHNHSTGKVRGLLCDKCNRAIGGFNDSPDLLRKAAIYLEVHNGKEIL